MILFHGCNGPLPRRLRPGEVNRLNPRVGHDRMRVIGASLECTDSHLRRCCRVQQSPRRTGQRFSDKAERRPAARQTHSTVLMLIRGSLRYVHAAKVDSTTQYRHDAGVHLHVKLDRDARRRSKFSSIVVTLFSLQHLPMTDRLRIHVVWHCCYPNSDKGDMLLGKAPSQTVQTPSFAKPPGSLGYEGVIMSILRGRVYLGCQHAHSGGTVPGCIYTCTTPR